MPLKDGGRGDSPEQLFEGIYLFARYTFPWNIIQQILIASLWLPMGLLFGWLSQSLCHLIHLSFKLSNASHMDYFVNTFVENMYILINGQYAEASD